MTDFRTMEETMAADGEPLLRKSDAFSQPDESTLPVPLLVENIWHRMCHAVAPNGLTTPYVTMEEWSAIRKWVGRHAAAAASE